MPDGELRFDLLTREWVNVVGHRQGRPNLPSGTCPFCVGGLEAPAPYVTRWFENRWPALAPGAPVDTATAAATGTSTLPSVGACEVVLYSPVHDESLWTLGLAGVRHVVDLWAERTSALLARPEVEYVLVIENRGELVGATISHPHGQIYGYPFLPPVPRREAEVAREHGCPVCAETAAEAAARARVVYDDGEWLAWVPYASAYGYGLRLAPRTHTPGLADLDASERDRFSALLVDVLGRYDRLWERPSDEGIFPYMFWIHQAPAHHDGEYHLHVHTAPPLRSPSVQRFVASAELGSGTFSNPVVPEDAAAALRAAVAPGAAR